MRFYVLALVAAAAVVASSASGSLGAPTHDFTCDHTANRMAANLCADLPVGQRGHGQVFMKFTAHSNLGGGAYGAVYKGWISDVSYAGETWTRTLTGPGTWSVWTMNGAAQAAHVHPAVLAPLFQNFVVMKAPILPVAGGHDYLDGLFKFFDLDNPHVPALNNEAHQAVVAGVIEEQHHEFRVGVQVRDHVLGRDNPANPETHETNIVRGLIIDVATGNFVIEFIPGAMTYGAYRAQNPAPNAIDMYNMIRGVAQGVHNMHDAGFAHFDLHGGNMMFHNNVWKVIDLGKAVALDNAGVAKVWDAATNRISLETPSSYLPVRPVADNAAPNGFRFEPRYLLADRAQDDLPIELVSGRTRAPFTTDDMKRIDLWRLGKEAAKLLISDFQGFAVGQFDPIRQYVFEVVPPAPPAAPKQYLWGAVSAKAIFLLDKLNDVCQNQPGDCLERSFMGQLEPGHAITNLLKDHIFHFDVGQRMDAGQLAGLNAPPVAPGLPWVSEAPGPNLRYDSAANGIKSLDYWNFGGAPATLSKPYPPTGFVFRDEFHVAAYADPIAEEIEKPLNQGQSVEALVSQPHMKEFWQRSVIYSTCASMCNALIKDLAETGKTTTTKQNLCATNTNTNYPMRADCDTMADLLKTKKYAVQVLRPNHGVKGKTLKPKQISGQRAAYKTQMVDQMSEHCLPSTNAQEPCHLPTLRNYITANPAWERPLP